MDRIENDGNLLQRQEERWWLPSPKVPADGLSSDTRKHLKHQRESINQILKAALAVNAQVLSEMKVPSAYVDSLPKVWHFECVVYHSYVKLHSRMRGRSLLLSKPKLMCRMVDRAWGKLCIESLAWRVFHLMQ